MPITKNNNLNARTRPHEWVFAAIAAGLLIFAAWEVSGYSMTNLGVLSVSAVVALITGKYRSKVPFTRIEFQPKTVMAFWGAMWLGIGGGVIIGALASFADRYNRGGSATSRISGMATDIGAAFLSAAVYYLSVGYLAGQGAIEPVSGVLLPNEVLAATLLMAIMYFLTKAAMSLFDDKGAPLGDGAALEKWSISAKSCIVTAFATMVLYLVINYFGIEFGLVILPLVVAGNLAYKIYTRTLEQKTRQISDASRLHLATVEALATAIDARDQVGMGHVRRTQIYAVGMGNVLGLGEEEINALRTGALLHDIGKLAVPDHILNKPGRLTPAEMAKMKIHSQVGALILEEIGFPYPVVPIVKYHHERWDGAGYPEGLMGTNIPITARILAIADAFDTLRGDRPYRVAVTKEEAAEFLRSRAGNQFDPVLVDLFLRNVNTFDAEIISHGLSYETELAKSRAASGAPMHENSSPNYAEQIKRANHEVFTLYSLARDFSSSLSLDETLSLFTRKVAEFAPYDSCVVYLVEPSGESAVAMYAVGTNDLEFKDKRIKIGEGATGYALKKRQPVANVDPVLDFAFSDSDIGKDYTTMLCLPLIADTRVVGAVSLYSSALSNYQDEHIRLVDTVSRIAADAIEKALRHAEAQTYALTDPLTGLPNSRSLQIAFDKEVTRASRGGTNFQLLVLDLDGFKSVNDTYGHKVGDTVLKDLAGLIKDQMREYDFLARYGGDEFVAIVPETDPADVKRLQRRIEEAVGNYILPVGDAAFARVGISLGSASYPSQGESFDELVVAADKAMYLTKAINRQRARMTDGDPEDGGPQGGSSGGNGDLAQPSAEQPEEKEAEVLLFDESDIVIVEADESHIILSAAIN